MGVEIWNTPSGQAIVHTLDGDFNCPKCTCPHTYDDYYKKYEASKHFAINIKCKGCKEKLGLTFDYHNKAVVWLKSEEKKPTT